MLLVWESYEEDKECVDEMIDRLEYERSRIRSWLLWMKLRLRKLERSGKEL